MSTSCESDKFVTLIASLEDVEPIIRRVRKDVIQSESAFLKEYIEDGATEIKIPLRRPKNLNSILKYFYEGKLTVSKEGHLESLWNDARILGLVNLEKVCIQRLTDAISLDSWIHRLEFSQAEGCHELESNVLSFVNANFEDCSNTSSFTSLSVDQMVQVLQLPVVNTTVPVSNRIALILDWIKVNEVDRSPQAHRLLEQVDLTKLTENSLHSLFDEEPAFRNWRCVAIFESAIRLKILEEAARDSNTVPTQPEESDVIEADPDLVHRQQIINIKQEVDIEESSSDAEDAEVNESYEDSACRISMKQEVSPPSIYEAMETVESSDDDSSPPKMPRLEYSQVEAEPAVDDIEPPSRRTSSTQKQILYLGQRSNLVTSLSFVTISADSISQPQQALAGLPKYIHGVPKLIWAPNAQTLFFLGEFVKNRCKFPLVNYMHGKGAPKLAALPTMLHRRQQYQPVFLYGRVYVVGGSKSLSFDYNNRLSQAEVLDTRAPTSEWGWKRIPSVNPRRDLYAAVCVDGKIYIIGGAIDSPMRQQPSVTKHVMRYDLKKKRWHSRNHNMTNYRCGHAAVVHCHKIYVFGGSGRKYDEPSKDVVNMKSAEVYDIRQNKWTLIAPMLRPRYGGSALEIDGKIFIIGGDQSNEGKGPSSVECYDPLSDSWTLVSESVDDQGIFDSIAVIDDPEYFLKGS